MAIKEKYSVNYSELLSEVLTKKGLVSQCFNTFHNYSVNNQFLLYWQLHKRGKQISPVNSYARWQALGRQVERGQEGMFIWVPMTQNVTITDKETGEKKHIPVIKGYTFKKGAFSYDQTFSIKDTDKPLTFDIPDFDFNKVYEAFEIKLIPFEKLNGNIQGYAKVDTKELALNPLAEDPEMTILHEVAHIALDHSNCKYSKELKELEAEAVAYIVGSALGVNEKQLEHSRGYIQSWFKEAEIPEQNAKRIMGKAQKILEAGMGKDKLKGK